VNPISPEKKAERAEVAAAKRAAKKAAKEANQKEAA
jgi:hypothetical protein